MSVACLVLVMLVINYLSFNLLYSVIEVKRLKSPTILIITLATMRQSHNITIKLTSDECFICN